MSRTRTVLILLILVGGIGGPSFAVETPGNCQDEDLAATLANDPGACGPFAVSRDEYDLGHDIQIAEIPIPVELVASVHYPTDLSQGPYPAVVLVHGNAPTCRAVESTIASVGVGDGLQIWPCPSNEFIVTELYPSYRGYDYFADILASHGYIVISISTNAINIATSYGAFPGGSDFDARARVIDAHLWIWYALNAYGHPAFGDRFLGAVDLTKIGTMGHSRGVGGILTHNSLNTSLNRPFEIKAMMALAGTAPAGLVTGNPPLAIVMGYCDTDAALGPIELFDSARYASTNELAPKYAFVVMGGNHNFFNTVWGAPVSLGGKGDDASSLYPNDPYCSTTVPSNQRLSRVEQQAVLEDYGLAFFRTHLGGDFRFLTILSGESKTPSSTNHDIRVSFHAPSALRLDVNRFDVNSNTAVNSLGPLLNPPGAASVVSTGLDPFNICGEDLSDPDCLGPTVGSQQKPHNSGGSKLGQLEFGLTLSSSGTLSNFIPAEFGNVSRYRGLQFRAGVNFVESTPGQDLDFDVILVDAAGSEASVAISAFSDHALNFPPGDTYSHLPRFIVNTVHIPLSAFDGVDLSDLREIRFDLGSAAIGGVINVADLAFSDFYNRHDGLGVVRNNGSSTPQSLLLDFDGNGVNDETRALGLPGDGIVSGDWDGNGIDGIAIVRDVGSTLEWTLNVDRTTPESGSEKVVFGNIGDIPLAGDFDRDGVDELVVYSSPNGVPTFNIKYSNGTTRLVSMTTGLVGETSFETHPLVGDWNGDGFAGLAIVRWLLPGTGNPFSWVWNQDDNLDGVIDSTPLAGTPLATEPIAADINGDGKMDLGTIGAAPGGAAGVPTEWLFDSDHDEIIDMTISFSGQALDRPLVGNW